MKSSYVKKNSFYDFYNHQNVLPVTQNLENIDEFVFRRNYLYTTLGIPLGTLNNKKIIEFGPGGGFNAVATAHFEPNLYTFVDASKKSLEQLRFHNQNNFFKANNIRIEECDIFDFTDKERYDLVIVEGVIPGQHKPRKLLRHVSSFTQNGGLLILTSTTAVSLLSEICRRVLRVRLLDGVSDFAAKARITSEFFASHLEFLATSTRPPLDWAIDVILHDWHNDSYIFSLKDSIETINEEFQFYNSSPKFLTDDRWYKKVIPGSVDSNTLALLQYHRLCSTLIDHRYSINEMIIDVFPEEIEFLSIRACEIHNEIINQNNFNLLFDFLSVLQEIEVKLPDSFKLTKASIKDYRSDFKRFLDDPFGEYFQKFKKWWGRGQQYASFLRKF